MDETQQQRQATLRLIAGASVLSFAPVFVALIPTSPTTSAFYRTLLAGIILSVIVFVRRHRFSCPPRTLLFLVAGGAAFAADLASWHRSIHYVGPGLATLLGNLQVFALAGFGILVLREPARWELLVSVPVAVIGLAMIVGLDWSALEPQYRAGLAFGLLTACFYAVYILCLRQARKSDPDGTAIRDLALISLISALFLLPIAMVEGVSLQVSTWQDGMLLLAYALVSQVIGWSIISGALPRVPASLVGLILLLQPLLTFVWDVAFFARPMTVREAIGGVLVLLALYLGSRPR
ncbi:MAG: DMT family transporter [Myxococcota bacterium]